MVEDEYFIPVSKELWEKYQELESVIPVSENWKDMKTITLQDSRICPYPVSFEKTDRAGSLKVLEAWKKYYEANGLSDCSWIAEKSSKLAKIMRLSALELISRGFSVSFDAYTGTDKPVRHTIRNLDEFDIFPWNRVSWCEQLLSQRPSLMKSCAFSKKNEKTDASENSEYYLKADEKREEDRYVFRLPGTSAYVNGSPSLFQLFKKLYPGYDFQESRIEGKVISREQRQPVKAKDRKEAKHR